MRHEHEDEDDEDPEGGRGGRSSRGEAAGREGRDGGKGEGNEEDPDIRWRSWVVVVVYRGPAPPCLLPSAPSAGIARADPADRRPFGLRVLRWGCLERLWGAFGPSGAGPTIA